MLGKVRIMGVETGAEDVRWDGSWQEENEKCQNSMGKEECGILIKARASPEVARSETKRLIVVIIVLCAFGQANPSTTKH